MKNTTNVLLLVIAIALVAIAVEPLSRPSPAQAQVMADYPLYFEPGLFIASARWHQPDLRQDGHRSEDG